MSSEKLTSTGTKTRIICLVLHLLLVLCTLHTGLENEVIGQDHHNAVLLIGITTGLGIQDPEKKHRPTARPSFFLVQEKDKHHLFCGSFVLNFCLPLLDGLRQSISTRGF